ncbi:MAG TPA: HAD-IB family phosphatase [Acidimicrobiales bacterium]|nr:HAD-IB family phosphatase [Acidimicrobiales bacterium]
MVIDDLDLSSASVFLDFDGTISLGDTGVHLLNRLAGDSWRAIEELYASGEIGSRECITRQWALLATEDESRLRSVAAEIPIDDYFEPLVDALLDAGAEVSIVSDGFGFVASDVGESMGIAVKTATIDWATGAIAFPDGDETCLCARCGTCKQAPLREAAGRGRTTIFVGDGLSDQLAAPGADLLFATDQLARWCDLQNIPYRPFLSLGEVAAALGLLG